MTTIFRHRSGQNKPGNGGLKEDEVDPLGFAKPPERPFWHLKNTLFDIQWSLGAARYEAWRDAPETQAAFAEVDRQRALWSKVDYERNAAEFIRDQYAEPALTRERRDRLDRMLARRAAKLSIALAAARAGGVSRGRG